MAILPVKEIGTIDSNTGGAGDDVTITVPAGGVAAGNTLFIGGSLNAATTTIDAVSDSRGNTYTVDKTQVNSGNVLTAFLIRGEITTALQSGDVITISFSTFVGVVGTCHEFSGLLSPSVDKTASGNSGFGTSHTSGATAATAQADELLIGSHGYMSSSAVWTSTGSFTKLRDLDGANSRSHVLQYQIVSATGAYASTGTTDISGDSANIIGTYKASAGGPSPQTARARATITQGTWTDQAGGANLHAAIDEAVIDDADYIKSAQSPVSADIAEIALDVLNDPVSSTGHVVSYRYDKDVAAGDTINLTVRLMQGATEIASWTHNNIGNGFVQADQTLSGAQADAITDYSNLRLKFEAIKV